jgi:Tfp pilus assembly protein PilF
LVERSFRALQSGELQAAQGRAEEALRLAPDNWRGWEASGLVLEQLGRSAEAESSYRRLIELRPQYARGRIHLAGAYIAQGQDSQAERELRGALEIDPDLPDAHYGLALVLLRRGQKLPALEQLRIVISLSPKFQPAYQAAIQILESLPASENTTQEAQKLRQRLNALFTTTKQLR